MLIKCSDRFATEIVGNTWKQTINRPHTDMTYPAIRARLYSLMAPNGGIGTSGYETVCAVWLWSTIFGVELALSFVGGHRFLPRILPTCGFR